jgi:hypothetical protein
MMMNAHTTGPWNLYREKWGWCVGPGKAIGKGYIADVHETVNSNTGRPTKESVANANLIAAAPDLLEAPNGATPPATICSAPLSPKPRANRDVQTSHGD